MKRVFCLILLVIFSACSKNVEQPENLVNEEKMVNIMTEIYLYQQSSYLQELKNKQPDFAKIDAQLIKKHGVEIQDFEESYRFYVLQPEKYRELLNQVRENLEKQLPENERKKRIEEKEKLEKEKK